MVGSREAAPTPAWGQGNSIYLPEPKEKDLQQELWPKE